MAKTYYEITQESFDEILNLVRLEQHLIAKLKSYKRYQELQNKMLEEVKGIAERLKHSKHRKEWWNNVDPDLKEIIKKYAKK